MMRLKDVLKNVLVLGIMAGDGTYGCSGVLYIDIQRPTDVKEEQA